MATENQCFNMVGNEKAKKRKRGYLKSTGILPKAQRIEVEAYANWLKCMGYATSTIESYKGRLRYFFLYQKDTPVTQASILNFNHYLHAHSFSSSHISNYINAIKKYSAFLEATQSKKVLIGEVPIEKSVTIPRVVFTKVEIQQLFKVTEDSVQGYFDRAWLSLYYGCGLRSSEGIRLKPSDLDYKKGLLYVAPGKNYQDRYVPLSTDIIRYLQEYEAYSRLYIHSESSYFLVSPIKGQSNGEYLNKRLRVLQEKAGINKEASLHSLRHSIATHLLSNGMEVESIARFLGHQSLEATQRYTHILGDEDGL